MAITTTFNNNRVFPSYKNTHFQDEAKCKTSLVKMSSMCMRIKIIFILINGFTLSLALKQRFGVTQKWLITIRLIRLWCTILCQYQSCYCITISMRSLSSLTIILQSTLDSLTLANSNPALTWTNDFLHTFTMILPSVTRTLDNSNLPLTWSDFCFPSDLLYNLPSITRYYKRVTSQEKKHVLKSTTLNLFQSNCVNSLSLLF